MSDKYKDKDRQRAYYEGRLQSLKKAFTTVTPILGSLSRETVERFRALQRDYQAQQDALQRELEVLEKPNIYVDFYERDITISRSAGYQESFHEGVCVLLREYPNHLRSYFIPKTKNKITYETRQS